LQFNEVTPPRLFTVGSNSKIDLTHVANCKLASDEILTFFGPLNQEYDLVAKEWGFYATPSINSRLASFGIMTALAEGVEGKQFVHLVYKEKVEQYKKYCKEQDINIITWLYSETLI